MGNVISQVAIMNTNDLTEEVQQSLKQILQAYNHELAFDSRRQRRHHPSSVARSPNIPIEETIHHSQHHHHRSRSLDQYHIEEHHRTTQTSLSTIRRQWQCQLCHTKNESDALICTDCGSNKINVYIPIMDHMSTNQHLHNSPSLISTR